MLDGGPVTHFPRGHMDERGFEALAAGTLARLAERLEEALGDDVDVELRDGVLTVELADRRQIVVNRHAPTRELWLSSPVSGAAHFAWIGDGWRSTRGDDRLEARLAGDLADLTGTRVDLA